METKSSLLAYLLLLFLGVIGIHRFYFGHFWWGLLYFFTGGFFLIGVIVDIFLIPGYVRDWNQSSLRLAHRPAHG